MNAFLIEPENASIQEDVSAETVSPLNPLATLNIAADSLERLRPQDVERVIYAAVEIGDDHLADVHKLIRKGTPEQRAALDETMGVLGPFMEDITNPYLKMHFAHAERKANQYELRQEIQKTFGDDLSGLQLSNGSHNCFVIFLRDASEPGRFRYAFFTENGLNGHSTHNNFPAALDDAIQCGYRTIAAGTLEAYEALDSFKNGNEQACKIQRMNTSYSN